MDLRTLRGKKSLRQVADLGGLSASTIHRAEEKGIFNVEITTGIELAKIYKVSFAALVGELPPKLNEEEKLIIKDLRKLNVREFESVAALVYGLSGKAKRHSLTR